MRQPGEEVPIGLILCAEPRREQVELLQMHKDGITVAEYWTELPPNAELEQRLHAALLEARERLARAGCCWGIWMMSDAILQGPEAMRRRPSAYDPTSSTIKVMTMKVSKALVFTVVVEPAVQPMPVGATQARRATAYGRRA